MLFFCSVPKTNLWHVFALALYLFWTHLEKSSVNWMFTKLGRDDKNTHGLLQCCFLIGSAEGTDSRRGQNNTFKGPFYMYTNFSFRTHVFSDTMISKHMGICCFQVDSFKPQDRGSTFVMCPIFAFYNQAFHNGHWSYPQDTGYCIYVFNWKKKYFQLL